MKSLTKRVLSIFLCAVLAASALILPSAAYLGDTTRRLINSASLVPQPTGYSRLDKLVANFFASNFSSSDDTYTKLKKCYDYLIYGSSYGNSNIPDYVYSEIYKECNYYSEYDTIFAAEAYGFLTSKRGSCNDFSSAFLVLARAIGLEAYVIKGEITWYAGTNDHVWCLIKLGGEYYLFDPEAEWRNYDNNGSISYSNFCINEKNASSRKGDKANWISRFGNFKCRNKNNTPGTLIQGDQKPSVVYTTGSYKTDEIMNFRKEANSSAAIICTIPAGTTVKVTAISGVWGKITYLDTTGWISLEYSTKIADPEPETTTTYKTGKYKLLETMNLRADHSTSASILGIIPAGTQVSVTKVFGEWGQVTYNKIKGWISLSYSEFVSSPLSKIPGDVNGDKVVDSADARLVLRYSVSLEKISKNYIGNADVNKDGAIDSADARIILRKAVNLEA